MKKLIAIIASTVLLAVLLPAQQGTLTKFGTFIVSNGVSTAQVMVSTNLKVMKVTFIGVNSLGVSNSAAVFVGPSTNATYKRIAPGEEAIIVTQPGTCINLNDWYLRTPTTTDLITVVYQ